MIFNLFYSFHKLFIIFCITCIVTSKFESKNRKWTSSLNPGCPNNACNASNVNIIYAKGVSDHDILHFVYAGGNYTETLSSLLFRSEDKNSGIEINWEALFNGTKPVLNFKGSMESAFGLIFTNFYEYNDTKDTAKMEGNIWYKWNFNEFEWDTVKEVNGSENLMYSFKSSKIRFPLFLNEDQDDSFEINNNNIFGKDGSLKINFNLTNSLSMAKDMPRLKYDGNNTLLDLILDNLNSTFKNSRFAIQVALVNLVDSKNMSITETKSLDDEESPGVFRLNNFLAQSSDTNVTKSAYLQWKPVCFLSKTERSLKTISLATIKKLKSLAEDNLTENVIKSSLVYMWFGDSILLPNNSMRLLNITFGMPDDKFYQASKYLVWSSSFGQGTPPTTSLSMRIILVIAFGLGLPFVLIVIGSIYLFVKRSVSHYSQSNVPYDSIN